MSLSLTTINIQLSTMGLASVLMSPHPELDNGPRGKEFFYLLQRPAFSLGNVLHRKLHRQQTGDAEDPEAAVESDGRLERGEEHGDDERQRPVHQSRHATRRAAGTCRKNLGHEEHRHGAPSERERHDVADEAGKGQPAEAVRGGRVGAGHVVVEAEAGAAQRHAETGQYQQPAPTLLVHHGARHHRGDHLDHADDHSRSTGLLEAGCLQHRPVQQTVVRTITGITN